MATECEPKTSRIPIDCRFGIRRGCPMPDAGENKADEGKSIQSDLSKSGAVKKTDGFTYLDLA